MYFNWDSAKLDEADATLACPSRSFIRNLSYSVTSLATQSIEARPDMVHAGRTNYVNSFMTMSALLADVANGAVTSAPVHLQLQNKTRWAEWMGMGDRPGGTVARGFGSKIRDLDALPPAVAAGARRLVPEIFDTKNWTEFVFEDTEYLRERDAAGPGAPGA